MPNKPYTPQFFALSPKEIKELDSFLLSNLTSDETMMLDTLDGYLTALVIGPVSLKPSLWLPRVWGPKVSDEPAFETMAQAQHVLDLILRHMSGIMDSLRHDADAHVPIFDTLVYTDDPREYADGEMWAHGFMTGIDLCRKDWQPFLSDPEGAEMLRPIYLLGSDEVTPEEMALTEMPEQREEIGKQIPASLARIYRYWQPVRQAEVEHMGTATIQRDQPKVGRNDPCPCGSGKKFKKCCGAH
ncbi:MAG: hypothetical protein A2061_06115 [Gallionellales bacterium GWA2_59_43]|nr:MAG: hypothetical protein A2061_06115 [Gallionellales bacterium GWA2_59_43]